MIILLIWLDDRKKSGRKKVKEEIKIIKIEGYFFRRIVGRAVD